MIHINMDHFWAVHACLSLGLVHICWLVACWQGMLGHYWVGGGVFNDGEGGGVTGEDLVNVAPHPYQGLSHLKDHKAPSLGTPDHHFPPPFTT